MKCLFSIISLFVIIYCVNAGSIYRRSSPVESTIANPCTQDALYVLRYYQPYPSDETKYIECNPWGFYTVKSCESGFKWNSWLQSCVRIMGEPAMMPPSNMDKGVGLIDVEDMGPMPTGTNETFCSFFGNFTCMNGGICAVFIDGFSKCLCLSNYTGRFCEIYDPLSRGVFGELINKTFSLDLYKKQRPLLNDSVDFNMTIDTSIQWDEITKQKISQYLALFPNGTIRFDVLVNYLVEDFVGQLYPTSFYLQEFNYPTELQTGLSGAIPNLLLTSKYSYDRFKEFMILYEDILENVVDYLSVSEKSIDKQAELFYEVYDQIFKKVDAKSGPVANKTELTREEMISKIWADYNQTLSNSFELFRLANKFDDELALKGENYTTEEVVYAIGNFSMSPEVVRLMSDIHTTNADIWDSLSFYGFWYILSSYVVPPSGSVRQTYALNSTLPMDKPTRSLDDDTDFEDVDMATEATTIGERDLTTVEPRIVKDATTERMVKEVTVTPRVIKDVTTEPVTTRVVKDVETTTFRPERELTTARMIKEVTVETVTPRIIKDVTTESFTTPRIVKDVETTFRPERELTTEVPRPLRDSLVTPTTLRPEREFTTESITTPRIIKDVTSEPVTTPRMIKEVTVETVTPRIIKDVTTEPVTTPRMIKEVTVETVTPRVIKDVTTESFTTPRIMKDVESTWMPERELTTEVPRPLRDLLATTLRP